jgi:hypothetical protein
MFSENLVGTLLLLSLLRYEINKARTHTAHVRVPALDD